MKELALLGIITLCIFATCVSYMFVVVNVAMKIFAIVSAVAIIIFWIEMFKKGCSNGEDVQ